MDKLAGKREQGKKPLIVKIKRRERRRSRVPRRPNWSSLIPSSHPRKPSRPARTTLLTRFWLSARGFWGSTGDRLAWPFSIGLVLLIVRDRRLPVRHQCLESRDLRRHREARGPPPSSISPPLFIPLAIGSIVLGVIQVFARMGIQRRWRAWLTNSVLTRWLKNGRYYQLNLVGGDHKNPEYRIAEDLRIATDSPVDFLAGVTSAFLSAATFIVVLWTIGGALTAVARRHRSVTIPGFLVIAAMLYAAIASRLDPGDRPPVRAGLRGQEPSRGRFPLHADPRAREWREHRAARR